MPVVVGEGDCVQLGLLYVYEWVRVRVTNMRRENFHLHNIVFKCEQHNSNLFVVRFQHICKHPSLNVRDAPSLCHDVQYSTGCNGSKSSCALEQTQTQLNQRTIKYYSIEIQNHENIALIVQ